MSEQFDPYYKWLGIPPKDQPPNHYRLLGVELFEENPEVIETAADRQASYLHEVSCGPRVKDSQKLLNEVAAARLCLLDPEKKSAYDARLQSKLPANVSVDALTGEDSSPDLPWDDSGPVATSGSSTDTAGKGEATSEALRRPTANLSAPRSVGISSGVFSSPKLQPGTESPQQEEADTKTLGHTTRWLAVGAGVLVIVVAAVVFLLVSSGDEDTKLADNQLPQQIARKPNTSQGSGATTKNGNQGKPVAAKPATGTNGSPSVVSLKIDSATGEDDRSNTNHGSGENGKSGIENQPVVANAATGANGSPSAAPLKVDSATGGDGKSTTNPGSGETTENGTGKQPVMAVPTTGTNDSPPVAALQAVPTLDGDRGSNTSSGSGEITNDGDNPFAPKQPTRTNGFQPVTPLEVTSLSGATAFKVLDTDFVLADGGNDDDVYTIQAKIDFPDVTAIRIEALPHDALPGKGPGLGSNGGFSVSEVGAFAAPDAKDPIPLSGVESTEAPGAIENLTDGNSHSYWPVRRGGQPTTLTMFLNSPIGGEDGTILYVKLAQREKIGHFRISVSNDPEMVGRTSQIEARLPLFVNLGGPAHADQAGRNWLASQPFESGAFGYVGGNPTGSDRQVPFTSCISGIKEFRANVPDGQYDVILFFSGRWPPDVTQRSFTVSALGIETQPVRIISRRMTGIPLPLKNVEAKDGVLVVEFIPEVGEPVLNGIGIERAK